MKCRACGQFMRRDDTAPGGYACPSGGYSPSREWWRGPEVRPCSRVGSHPPHKHFQHGWYQCNGEDMV